MTKTLDAREEEVTRLREMVPPMTFREIAGQWDRSAGRVRQIYVKAQRKLRGGYARRDAQTNWREGVEKIIAEARRRESCRGLAPHQIDFRESGAEHG